ncbi:HEPN domain-containing protein [Roseimarinus sediminis]|uniref:HEPN domain-containing protein n=1 Tax=Roseimarinus sediminis TaxID=1610899 RepID=UPI003D25034D
MIDKDDRDILIQYRLDQANQTISEVSKLIEINLLNVAVNRIYYGIFYCLTALALKFEFASSKHAQLIGWFNQSFIKTGQIEVKYGKIIRDAYKNRSDGDYAPFITFSKEDVLEMHTEMTDFIERINSYLSTTNEKNS